MLDHDNAEILSKQKPAHIKLMWEVCDITCSSKNHLDVHTDKKHSTAKFLNNYIATNESLSENVSQKQILIDKANVTISSLEDAKDIKGKLKTS